jgi:hypothetical protein
MSRDAPPNPAVPAADPDEVPVHPAPHPEQELIMHLEPDQLVTETFRPVPRAKLSRRAVIGLLALRVFVVLVSLMVLYTFIVQLH